MIKRIAKLLFTGCITVACGWWVMHRAQLGITKTVMLHADARWLGVAGLVYAMSLFVRAVRWHLILKWEHPSMTVAHSYQSLTIGYLVNNFLPGKLGEIAKCATLVRRTRIHWQSGLIAILLDRIVDGVGLAVLGLIAVWIDCTNSIANSAVAAGSALFFGLATTLVVGSRSHSLLRWINTLLHHVGQSHRAETINAGRAQIRHIQMAPKIGKILGLSLANWAFEAGVFWGCAASVHHPITIESAILLTAVVSFGGIVLSTPGGIGGHELLVMAALSGTTISPEVSLSIAVISHVILMVPPALMGIVSAITIGGFDLQTLRTLRQSSP